MHRASFGLLNEICEDENGLNYAISGSFFSQVLFAVLALLYDDIILGYTCGINLFSQTSSFFKHVSTAHVSQFMSHASATCKTTIHNPCHIYIY